MFYEVRLLRGLFAPYVSAHQLDKAEQFKGIWKKTTFVLLISLFLSGMAAYFGIGNESLSKLIYDASLSEFETMKGLFGIGQVIQGIVATALMIFFPSLLFWVFTDIEYRKLVTIQLFVTMIFMIEKAILIPLQLFLGLDLISSPFALGVMAHYITDAELLIHFFSTVSIFGIWAMFLQFQYLKITTEKSSKYLLLLIISINLFMWIFTALFSYIKFEVFL